MSEMSLPTEGYNMSNALYYVPEIPWELVIMMATTSWLAYFGPGELYSLILYFQLRHKMRWYIYTPADGANPNVREYSRCIKKPQSAQ